MKRIVLLFLFTISAIVSKAQANADDEQRISMLRSFYTAYMSAFSAPDEPPHHFEEVLTALRKKYLTAKCQKQFRKLVNETDADPVIGAQDSDAEWAKTLSFKKGPKNDGTYIVSYYDNEYGADKKMHKVVTTIKLRVVQEKSGFKIDYIFN
jgi:hypothetical protein